MAGTFLAQPNRGSSNTACSTLARMSSQGYVRSKEMTMVLGAISSLALSSCSERTATRYYPVLYAYYNGIHKYEVMFHTRDRESDQMKRSDVSFAIDSSSLLGRRLLVKLKNYGPFDQILDGSKKKFFTCPDSGLSLMITQDSGVYAYYVIMAPAGYGTISISFWEENNNAYSYEYNVPIGNPVTLGSFIYTGHENNLVVQHRNDVNLPDDTKSSMIKTRVVRSPFPEENIFCYRPLSGL